MTLLAGAVWTVVDDDGTGETGTEFDSAFVAAVKASIEAQIHSASNPTVEPNEIIDEVVAARGVEASLDARLDAIDTAIAGSVVSAGIVQQTLGQTNMAQNELFLIWPQSDSTDPAYWAKASGTVARTGTGLADTNTKIGDFSAKLTRAAVVCLLYQRLLNSSDFLLVADVLQDVAVGLGAWVRSSAIGGARIFIDDGVGRAYSTANTTANAWEWLTVSRTLDAAATELTIGLSNDTNASDAYINAPTFMFIDAATPPTRWVPSAVTYDNLYFFISGNVSTGTLKFLYQPQRPGIVKDVQLIVGTAPVGADLIVDINTWDGAAYTSMFSAKPSIADGAKRGGAQPDDTYARRCLSQGVGDGTTILDGSAISIDVDQVGSGTPGANLGIMIRVLRPVRFWEAVTGYNFIGV